MRRLPREDRECQYLMGWVRMHERRYPALKLLHHIPNGGARSKAEAGVFKSMGVQPGVPDYHLPVGRGGYLSLYIEMKPAPYRDSSGKLVRPGPSPAQREWLSALCLAGHKAVVCVGWQQAVEVLEDYLRQPRTEVAG